MKSINFDEGYKEYDINGDETRVIRLRIADPNLVPRFEAASSRIDELQKKYVEATPENMIAVDKELRDILNEVFQTDVCTPAFGNAAVMSLTSSGKPLYQTFLEAFIPVVRQDIEAASMTAKINAPKPSEHVQKYLDKPAIAGMTAPALPDVSGLTPEQKAALLAQLQS